MIHKGGNYSVKLQKYFLLRNLLSNSFKWKHYEEEIILLNVRWYLKYPLSYRNLKEMMIERGIQVDHSTIMRWVHQYSPEIEQEIRRHLRLTNYS
jgi:transposase, IS6 family